MRLKKKTDDFFTVFDLDMKSNAIEVINVWMLITVCWFLAVLLKLSDIQNCI